MERRGQELTRPSSKARGFDIWILEIKRWLNNLFGRKQGIKAKQVLVTRQNELVLIRRFETTHSDDTSVRIRHWIAVSLHSDVPYDIVIVCDRLKRTQRQILTGDLTGLTKSHRLGIFRTAHYATSGRRRMDQVFVGDFDFVGMYAYQSGFGLDGYAPQIVDRVAIHLLGRKLWDFKLLFLFGDERGVESQQTRIAVGSRWESVIVAYYRDFFPNHYAG